MIQRFVIATLAVLCLAAVPTTQPEIRRGESMGGSPRERSQRYFEHLAAMAEPTGHADPARLGAYLAILKRDLVHDARLVAFAPTAKAQADGVVVLEGVAEYPELKATAANFLRTVGFAQVDNRMQVLPVDVPVGAVVMATRTFFYDKPDKPHETVTEALNGDVLFPLLKVNEMYLCHSAEGYLGYVNSADLRPLDVKALAAALNVSKPAVDEKIDKIIASARTLMGTPYVWGGRTSSGIDCSGLVHQAFESQGIILPRDADQQALCGTMVATRSFREGLHKGDLLFFISQRGSIHHVALYIGDRKFIEAADPGVKVSSFDPDDREYAKKRDTSFAFAKRVLQ